MTLSIACFWTPDATPEQHSALKPPQSGSVNFDKITRDPPSSTPMTTTLNEPLFEAQREQSPFSESISMDTDFIAPTTKRTTTAGASSSALPDYPPFKGKGILSENESTEIAHLKSRLYWLEQENESKDFIIDGLRAQIAELERSNKDLQTNLGGLTAMVLNMKLRIDGGEFTSTGQASHAQSLSRQPVPRLRQPFPPPPDACLDAYLASGPQNAAERRAKQKRLENRRSYGLKT